MHLTHAARTEMFIDNQAHRLLPEIPPLLYEARVFFAALGKVAEEKNLAMSMRIEKLHSPFLDYVNYLGLHLSLGMGSLDAEGKPVSTVIEIYRSAELSREHLNGGVVYPRLIYNRYRGRINTHFNHDLIMEAARDVFSRLQIL